MGRRVSAVKRFGCAETLAQGQFICPEQIKARGFPMPVGIGVWAEAMKWQGIAYQAVNGLF